MKLIYKIMFLCCLISSTVQAQQSSQLLGSFLGISLAEEVSFTDNGGMPPVLVQGTSVFYEVDMKLPTDADFDTATLQLGTTSGAVDLYTITVAKSNFSLDFDADYYLKNNQLTMRSTALNMAEHIYYEVKLFDNQGNCSYHTAGSL